MAFQGKHIKLFNFYRRPVGAYCIRPHNKISQPGVCNTPLQEVENSFMNFDAFAPFNIIQVGSLIRAAS